MAGGSSAEVAGGGSIRNSEPGSAGCAGRGVFDLSFLELRQGEIEQARHADSWPIES